MGDLFVLLILLSVQTTMAYSRICNETTQYLKEGFDLCCKKCQPGYHLKEDCSENKETVCEPCKPNRFLENWNYAHNCFSCRKCLPRKLLQYKENCTLTKDAVCVCEPGAFCVIATNESQCSVCKKYKECRPGNGVSVEGTPNSDVKCQECPNGTFSSISSNSEKCKPHTDCKGRALVKKGDATSDNICEDKAPKPPDRTTPRAPLVIVLTSTEANNPKTTKDFTTAARGFTQISNTSVSIESSSSTKNPHTTKQPDLEPVVIATSVVGIFLLLLIAMSLLFFYKRWRTDSAKLHPKVDANGNCENGSKIVQRDVVEHQKMMDLTSEQQCLLDKRKAGSEESQCSNSSDTLIKPDNVISDEPSTLHSNSDFNNAISALSEPMTLLSKPEAVTPQTSITAQPSSQPTSPQIISPVTNSPHVNVNITVHIGNGSYQTVNPIDTRQAQCQLPSEDEDCSVSTPKQEEGEQTHESVPECGANSTYYIPK